MTTTDHRSGDVVVIGIGNPFRRDDGVGVAVAERLRAQRLPGVRLAVSDGEAASLIELWEGARRVVVVDALRADPATPGRIHRVCLVDCEAEATGQSTGSDSVDDDPCGHNHAAEMDFGQAVELARVLGRLPRRMVLFAVEAGDVGFGPGLSPAVAAAAGRVAAEIVNQVAVAA